MSQRARLELILARIRHARTQLALHEDVFEATELLKVSESDLADIIAEMSDAVPKEPGV